VIEIGGLMYTATEDSVTSWCGCWRWLIMEVCV